LGSDNKIWLKAKRNCSVISNSLQAKFLCYWAKAQDFSSWKSGFASDFQPNKFV
jgi:hypothetical protein